MDNPTLRKALRLLVHPATLAALALLLANDHLLRRLWPSPLTGKLGDFAWLFVIPFAAAALLALIWPGSGRRRARSIAALAFGPVAVVFALAKTFPAVHLATVALATQAFGFPVGWRRDPTDLIALASVALAALLWRRTPEPPLQRASLRSPGWVALAMAALLTLANAPAPEPGIYCIDARDGELLAFAAYSGYRSVDGGLTWAPVPNAQQGACPNPWGGAAEAAVTAVDPDNEQRSYRFTPGAFIERSDDGGASWSTVYTPVRSGEATAAVIRKQSSSATVQPAPLDGKIDRVTGNAVFAMGHAGALVQRASDGAWLEVAVGAFEPPRMSGPVDYLSLLLGEMMLAVALALLGLATFATRTLVRARALWVFALAFGWLLWAAILFVFSPALASSYGSLFSLVALLALGVLLLITTIVSLVGLAQEGWKAAVRPLVVGFVAGALFLLPFALWATNALPRYLLAALLGTALGIITIAAGSRWLARDAAPANR